MPCSIFLRLRGVGAEAKLARHSGVPAKGFWVLAFPEGACADIASLHQYGIH